jgi:hypothetical protein
MATHTCASFLLASSNTRWQVLHPRLFPGFTAAKPGFTWVF